MRGEEEVGELRTRFRALGGLDDVILRNYLPCGLLVTLYISDLQSNLPVFGFDGEETNERTAEDGDGLLSGALGGYILRAGYLSDKKKIRIGFCLMQETSF